MQSLSYLPSVHTGCALKCNTCLLKAVSVSRCMQSLGRDPEAQQADKNRICKTMHAELSRMRRKPSTKRLCQSLHPELRRSLRCRECLRKAYLHVDASTVYLRCGDCLPKSVSASRCIQSFGLTGIKAKIEAAVPARYHQLDQFHTAVLAGPPQWLLIYGWELRSGVLVPRS